MISDDLRHALAEAINPRVRRNRRRLTNPWDIRLVILVAFFARCVRATPGLCRSVCGIFLPKREPRFTCGCATSNKALRRKPKKPSLYRLDCATGH